MDSPFPHRSVALAALVITFSAAAADIALIPFGSTWKYLDNGSNQGTAWRASAFNDVAWASGPAELGYGDGGEATVVSYGPSSSSKYITTYFRKTISIPNANAYPGYKLRIKRDDGVIVYLNGTEILRQNFNEGTISNTTLSYSSIGDNEEGHLLEALLKPIQFTSGNNTLAVEIHQSSSSSSDLSFDLELTGLDGTAGIHRGPYLQTNTSSGVTIVWTTDVPTDSRVRFGPSPVDLSTVVDLPATTLHHEVVLTGLQPNTTYYYAIGSSTQDLSSGDASTFFTTHPVQGSERPCRIWVIGDAGTAYAAQRSVRDSYINFTNGSHKADAWIMLGDNAYGHGRESEYQLGVFRNMYEGILRNSTLWPAPGNHDYDSGASASAGTGPYYELFAMPKLGQAGGVPSNTEAYYSFDIGNVHMISLDSDGVPLGTTGAMATWLTADLAYAKANSKWIMAYWHHPPYSKGSHNSDLTSDSGGLMRDMRQNIVPILEAYGVDLVLTGHSHSYERSYLIDGHYGTSGTFNPATMGKNMTSGRSGAPGAYAKPEDPTAHAGTVYTVCGVSGQRDQVGALNHPVMYLSTYSHYGSMFLDIVGDSLHAQFVNDAGTVVDHFDLVKPATHVELSMKVMLEGPYDPGTGTMRDDLRSAGLIPSSQPHNGIFTPVGGGGETVAASVLQTTGPTAIVDWVFLELRSKDNASLVQYSRSALLRRDGQVVDLDGTSPVRFRMPVGDYHIAVRHRNHLGAMPLAPVRFNNNLATVDLTLPATTTWGTAAQLNINGTMVLWSGDVVRDGVVRYTGDPNDRDPILQAIGGVVPTNTSPGYRQTDTSLDGVTKYTGGGNDRDKVLITIGGVVPTNVRVEQLP
ncbi:MAG TPA: metallophosphoesterase family protein [Flavobacteriales bacterium]|nr:metallophosphoesterase family protein [Flavobacteriales bacterium]